MKGHLTSIDGLRGVFAFLVIFYHCSYWLPLPFPDWLMSTLRIWGIYGVEGFFVISGIALSVSTKLSQVNSFYGIFLFFVKRYSRILPLYALLLLLYGHFFGQLGSRLIELSMLFGFIDPAKATLAGGWSIGVEFVFYFLFPFMVLLSKNSIFRAALLVFFAAALLVWHSGGFDLGAKLATQNNQYVHPANHFLFFVGGYFCGLVYQRGDNIFSDSFKKRYLFGFCLAIFVTVCIYGYNSDQIELMGGYKRIVLALLIIVMVGALMYLNTAGRLAEFLGDISYAIYLIHPFVVFKVLPHIHTDDVWLKLAFVLVVSVPLAYLSHRYFEMPMQRHLRKIMHA